MSYIARRAPSDCSARHARLPSGLSVASHVTARCLGPIRMRPNPATPMVNSCLPSRQVAPKRLLQCATRIPETMVPYSTARLHAPASPTTILGEPRLGRFFLSLPSPSVTFCRWLLVMESSHALTAPRRSEMAVEGTPSGMSALDLFVEFVRGQESTHAWWPRFLVALWGCLVLHVVLVGVGSAHDVIPPGALEPSLYFFPLLGAILVYSGVFATIVAVGIPRGSLVRHFAYGVTLPTFAYLIAGTISSLIRG